MMESQLSQFLLNTWLLLVAAAVVTQEAVAVVQAVTELKVSF
jgi:hypothetical protein